MGRHENTHHIPLGWFTRMTEARKAAGLTKRAFAEKLGLSERMYTDMAQGNPVSYRAFVQVQTWIRAQVAES